MLLILHDNWELLLPTLESSTPGYVNTTTAYQNTGFHVPHFLFLVSFFIFTNPQPIAFFPTVTCHNIYFSTVTKLMCVSFFFFLIIYISITITCLTVLHTKPQSFTFLTTLHEVQLTDKSHSNQSVKMGF